MTRSIRVDSTEYLHITLTSDTDLTGDTIEISLDEGATWHTGEHTTGGVRLLVGPTPAVQLAAGIREVLVKVHDSPEVPVISAGVLQVA